jgi:hypothetical protein
MGQRAPRPEPIRLPLPPGKVLVFDLIRGEVRLDDQPPLREHND